MTAPKPGTGSGEAVSSEATSKGAADPPPRKLFGAHPIKWVFGLEYMMQGLANPFQGITYQPFFKHLRV
ncbi:MAG: hypothetical protein RL033_1043, partial [Pseudomonadota bacterium]